MTGVEVCGEAFRHMKSLINVMEAFTCAALVGGVAGRTLGSLCTRCTLYYGIGGVRGG